MLYSQPCINSGPPHTKGACALQRHPSTDNRQSTTQRGSLTFFIARSKDDAGARVFSGCGVRGVLMRDSVRRLTHARSPAASTWSKHELDQAGNQ
eukprot:365718-Chlamydomonas_euryale.AAC.15